MKIVVRIIALAVAVAAGGAAAAVRAQMPPYQPGTSHQQSGPAWADAGHALLHRPYPWGSVNLPYPLINASFKHPMQAGTVRVRLDGNDVTDVAQIGAMGFEFTPLDALQIGVHRIVVTGATQLGARVTDGWTFAVTP